MKKTKSILFLIVALFLITATIFFIKTQPAITGNVIADSITSGDMQFKSEITKQTKNIYEGIYKNYNTLIKEEVKKEGYVDIGDVYAIIRQESKGNVLKVTNNGCMGIMPICYSSAMDYSAIFGKNLYNCRTANECSGKTKDSRFKAENSIKAGIKILSEKTQQFTEYSDAGTFGIASYFIGEDVILDAINVAKEQDKKENPSWNNIKKYITVDLLVWRDPFNDELGYFGRGKDNGLDEKKLQQKVDDLFTYVEYIQHYSKNARFFLDEKKEEYNQLILEMKKDKNEPAEYEGLEINTDYFGSMDIYTSKRTKKLDTVVVHHTGPGNNVGKMVQAMLNRRDKNGNPEKVSIHYFIDREGNIYQIASENKITGHAGCKKDNPLCVMSGINSHSIGIEIVNSGKIDDSYDKVYLNLEKLLKGITKKYDIPYDNEHILAHYEIYKQKWDPSPNFDWAKIDLPSHPTFASVYPGVCPNKEWAGKCDKSTLKLLASGKYQPQSEDDSLLASTIPESETNPV